LVSLVGKTARKFHWTHCWSTKVLKKKGQ